MSDLGPVPRCDFTKYSASGYRLGVDDPCDAWPAVPPTPVSGCPCPPNVGYERRKWALFLNLIPIAGQTVNELLGMPENCLKQYEAAADTYANAQAEFAALCSKASKDFLQVVVILNSIYKPDVQGGAATGILPDTLALALQPGVSRALYLSIVVGAVFLVALGLIATL
jgi:hypothetical protein